MSGTISSNPTRTTSKWVRLEKMKISEIAKTKQRHGKQLYHTLFIANWFLMSLREQREYPQS